MPDSCLVCKTPKAKGDTLYLPQPCGCRHYCKKCAMKCASGGKCKACGKMYSQFKRAS